MSSVIKENELMELPESKPLVPANNMLEVIERAALNPNVDVDKMRALLEMKKEIDAHQAEIEFNQAMQKCQSEIGRIAANKRNTQTNSDYADYAALDRVVRPVYTSNGFSLSFNTGEIAADIVDVICYVSHSGGHTRKYHAPMPADGKGPKGGDVMTKTHAAGSAMQYGMRYLLKLIFNIAIGKDDDGNGASAQVEKITEHQATNLQAMIDETKSDKKKYLALLSTQCRRKIEKLEDIPANALRLATDMLEKKRRAATK